jgi:hypothetical protein
MTARPALLGRFPAGLPEPADLLRGWASCCHRPELIQKASTFSRPDAIRGSCVRLPQGAAVAEVESLADRLLICPDVVALGAGSSRPAVERGWCGSERPAVHGRGDARDRGRGPDRRGHRPVRRG